jgi:hypothetical protein
VSVLAVAPTIAAIGVACVGEAEVDGENGRAAVPEPEVPEALVALPVAVDWSTLRPECAEDAAAEPDGEPAVPNAALCDCELEPALCLGGAFALP